MNRRFPKFGMSKDRFNNLEELAPLNLGKLAYHIEKGHLDTSKSISHKDLLECGVISKVHMGVKLLSKGREKFEALNVPIDMEIADASNAAIESIKDKGGNLSVQYRTPLLMRYHLKPHKFVDKKELKVPMPSPKKLKKLEKLRKKGLDVSYPHTPWFSDNVEKLEKEVADRNSRMTKS